jgi:DNA-binding NtrC family response regulator
MNETQASKNPLNASQSVPDRLGSGDEPIASLRSVRAETEVKAILAALKRTGWNRKQAARLLSISYRGLLYKIRQHKLESGVPSQKTRLRDVS